MQWKRVEACFTCYARPVISWSAQCSGNKRVALAAGVHSADSSRMTRTETLTMAGLLRMR